MDPHLFLFSKSRFENFNKWLQEDLSSPWVLYINILGNSEYPKGTWKAVSSRAFIRDAYGLVLISGGLLKPRTYNLYIHILGLKCLSPIDHSDLEDLDVINVDNVGKDAALNELYASELGNGGSVDALDTGFDNFTGGMSVSASKGVVLNKKSENRGILGNITSRLSGIMGTGNDTKSGKPRFVDLREMFGGKYGTRMLSNNIQEAFYFGGVDRDGVNSRGSRSTGGNLSELLASYASSENSVETRISSINQVGSYIGRSSSIKSCESSITESIFSVINSEIAETIQQPSVIVWTQNENTNGTKPSDLESKKERNSVKALINNNIMKIFKSVYSFLYTVENILFPSWLIPGWSDLSKKIAKSSILAEDDYNNFDLGVLTESDHVYNNNKSQFIYTAENDAILRDLVTANDLQGYIVSLVLNIVCAVFVAAFSMWVLYYYVFPWFLTGIRELQL
ncbi:hypothetical protein FG386_002077, partial [Cryptosporidium ryanae]|uniref:uncharacterized protein n=1 Tax=Cryptosporidium ryanae TaxID=515981 RepID=UPI00351A2914